MDRVKIGNTFRAIRVDLRMRQADVAERANVSQQRISDIECGRLGGISIETYCRVAGAIDADVQLTPRWRGPKLDRLLDRRHALLQNRVVEILAAAGWIVRTEFSFNLFGDRGSVDILACPFCLLSLRGGGWLFSFFGGFTPLRPRPSGC